MLLAPLGFLACFRRQRWGMAGAMAALGLIKRVWQWEQHIPLLVLISATTAAYGWTFDLLVMLIALIPALIRLVEIRRHPAAVALLATYLAVDVISLFTSWEQIFYAWRPLPFPAALVTWWGLTLLLALHAVRCLWRLLPGPPDVFSTRRSRSIWGVCSSLFSGLPSAWPCRP